MAHGFKNLGNATTFVTKRELAWHGLGKVVDAMTSAECMKLAGLDFTVDLAPMAAITPTALTTDVSKTKETVIRKDKQLFEGIHVPNNFATYRTDNNKVLGVVGNRYEVVQNIEAFEFFDSVIGQGHARYETAGALGDGETIFITAKLPTQLAVRKEDIDKYLLFTMSHDGSSAIKIMFTPIRVVCNNTLTAALHSKEKVTIKHTRNARERLDIAPKLLGIDAEASKRYEDVFNRFKEVPFSDKQVALFVDEVFNFEYESINELSTASRNKRSNILEYYETGVGQEGIQGTLWGAFSMVTGYLQNGSKKSNETQFKNEYLKTNADLRAKAMKNLLVFA